MQTEAGKKRFNVDEYYKMAGIGILRDGDRTELIDGEVIEMSPMGVRHSSAVKRANAFLSRQLQGRAVLSVQLPVRLNAFNEPQPDLALLRPRKDFYELRHPGPADVLLILEISDTSLQYEYDMKLRTYAASRIPEFWVLDPVGAALLVFREPSRGGYKTSLRYQDGDIVSMLAFPEIEIALSALLGTTSD